MNNFVTSYLDELRHWIAFKICPALWEDAERYWLLMDDVREVEHFIGVDIPEVGQALNWIVGKDRARNGAPEAATVSYMKYRSLAHFKDVLLNEYKRDRRRS